MVAEERSGAVRPEGEAQVSRQREEFKTKTRVCAKPDCRNLIEKPRTWLCDEHEEQHQEAVARAERRRQEKDK